MKKNDKLSNYMLAMAFIIVGIMLALDWLNINLFGLKGSWVALLLLLSSAALGIGQIVQKRKRYIFTPILFGIIGLMLLLISVTELTIAELWPMISLAFSLALLLSSILRDHVKLMTEIGFFGAILSIAFLVGTLFGLWNIVFPIVLVLGGVVIILRTALNKKEDTYEIPSVSIYDRAEETKNKIQKEETK